MNDGHIQLWTDGGMLVGYQLSILSVKSILRLVQY